MARRKDVTVDSRHDLSNDFVQALAADWKQHGIATIEQLRQTDAKAYCQIISQVVPKEMLIASDSSARADTPKDSREIAEALLADVGLVEPTDRARQRALDAYDTLIVALEQIRDEAVGLH